MRPASKKPLTPMKAIRAKCMDCSNFQNSEVKACTDVDCALWPYRLGHRPVKTTIKADAAEA